MAPPLIPITAQAAAMSVFSSLLAQTLLAYKNGDALSYNWPSVVKFAVYAILVTPLNVLWQTYLESAFPGTRKTKTGEKATDVKESLDVRNTVIKTLLDQSVGAGVNTLAFCVFMPVWAVLVEASNPANQSLYFAIAGSLSADFVDLMVAGWKFWPLVSIGNFTLVQDIATRNLVGGIAGIIWGVYVNLFAA